MSQSKAQAIVAQLMANVAGLRHGTVSVCIKLHDGRAVQVMYSTTENIKDSSPEAEDDTNQE